MFYLITIKNKLKLNMKNWDKVATDMVLVNGSYQEVKPKTNQDLFSRPYQEPGQLNDDVKLIYELTSDESFHRVYTNLMKILIKQYP